MRLTEPERPLEAAELGVPEPGDAGALVKVEASGVCHTDVHLNAGYYDLGEGRKLTLRDRGIELPRTLGHEIAGRVERLGARSGGVSVKEGDAVVVYPWIGCGSCPNCVGGRDNLCEGRPRTLGILLDGGYAEYVAVPDARFLVKLDGVTAAQAAPLACSGITAFSAVKKSRVGSGGLLVVTGVGGLGNSAVKLAKMRGAVVAALDISDEQLRLATDAGADHVLNTKGLKRDDVTSWVKGLGGGRGTESAIDFVGSPETFATSFSFLAKGGRLVSIGIFGGAAGFPIPILMMRSLEIIGNYTGTLGDLVELTGLVKDGRFSPLVSQTLPLAEVNKALDLVRGGRARGRILVSPALV